MIIPSARALTLRIADLDVTLDLSGCDDAMGARLRERYDAFSVPTPPDALLIRVRNESGPAYLPLDSATTWQVSTSECDGLISFESFFEQGWVDRSSRYGELVMRAHGDAENFLRVVYGWLCVEQDGLLLHACGVISRESGYVFFGPSGSGKSTVAGWSLDRTVLSDDLVIVRKVGAAYRLFGVPFRGDLPEAPRHNASADLRGIFALVKDTQLSVVRLSQSQAAARLAACAPFVMAQRANAERVMGICSDLVARVAVRELHFRRDPGFWELIDGLE